MKAFVGHVYDAWRAGGVPRRLRRRRERGLRRGPSSEEQFRNVHHHVCQRVDSCSAWKKKRAKLLGLVGVKYQLRDSEARPRTSQYRPCMRPTSIMRYAKREGTPTWHGERCYIKSTRNVRTRSSLVETEPIWLDFGRSACVDQDVLCRVPSRQRRLPHLPLKPGNRPSHDDVSRPPKSRTVIMVFRVRPHLDRFPGPSSPERGHGAMRSS